jgi:hypothetical protein
MTEGLNVSRVVDVDINFSPQAVPAARFDTLLVMGDSAVILPGEKMRSYNGIEEVALDFVTTAPEYLAADLYFAQIPQPDELFIGRWARTATAGILVGGVLSTEEKKMAHWTGITTGAFKIAIDGGAQTDITALDFSAETNLNGVAAKVTAKLTGATCVWNANHSRFEIKSGTTGTASAISFASAPATGTDVSALMKTTVALASTSGPGIAAETPLKAVVRVDGLGWYACTFAASTMPTDADLLAVGAYLEATTEKHLFGVTTSAATVLDGTNSTDIATSFMLGDYFRTMVQYSSTNPYAIASIFGRAFSTNFEGTNTMLTLKFKVEPLIIGELLTATQADVLAQKRCNVYVRYNNDTTIYQEGVMSGPAYFDEIHGLDWLANRIQTDMWNLLYQTPKVPQTANGMNMLEARVTNALDQAVNNGLVAPGQWNAPGFGNIYDGYYLSTGFYVYSIPIADQSQTDREQRVTPLIQVAVKMAGAVHFADCLINVNR